ncbi:hypothetical protein RKD39_003671 [Streptomyces albogriseolus]
MPGSRQASPANEVQPAYSSIDSWYERRRSRTLLAEAPMRSASRSTAFCSSP